MEITNYQLDQTGTWTIVASNSATVTGTAAYGLSLVSIPVQHPLLKIQTGGDIASGQTYSGSIDPGGIRMPLHFMVNKAMALAS